MKLKQLFEMIHEYVGMGIVNIICMKGRFSILILSAIIALLSACGEAQHGTSGSGYTANSNDPTNTTSKIYFYSAGHDNGNLGGRSGADATCESALPSELDGMEAHAFISVNVTDEIVDMPSNYAVPIDREIVGYGSETVIATSWADLLDSSLAVSLEQAGVLSAAATFWTGSNANGTLAVVNCSGWQDGNTGVFGAAGNAVAINNTWTYSVSSNCNTQRDLLCFAY